MIEGLLYEESYQKHTESFVNEVAVIVVKLLRKAIEEGFQDEEELIRILYKIEILLNYDSPTNFLKSQMLKSLGTQILSAILIQKITIFKSLD